MQSTTLFSEVGHFFAQMDAALMHFKHAGLDDRLDVWDLAHAATVITDRLHWLTDAADR